jgi:phosphoadenosine phosphosulfate reductase
MNISLQYKTSFVILIKSSVSRLTISQLGEIADKMENKSAYDVLKWAIDTYGTSIGLASSFGAEDVVLIDLMSKIDSKKAKIFTLDTGRLKQETYDIIDTIRKRYDITVEIYFPERNDVEQMVRTKGLNLMYDSIDNRKLCCNVRKVRPLARALSNLDAWITGLRRDQTSTRQSIKKVEIDDLHKNIVKVNPLADWNTDMIWDYIKKNNVPYNKLHDLGYPSIGCEPCTRAVKPEEDQRSGRWWWENSVHKECGLHWKTQKR